MAKNSRADNLEWRNFECLVALIESEAGPRGARVTSPDRIRDIDTGRLREVDASIRFRAGTIDVLVTIECRRRGRKADDTWIEQLATKRQKIGAARTIAVSSAGFSESARVSAERYGIELRELQEIQPKDIDTWFLPHGIVHLFRHVEDVQCSVHLPSGTTEVVDTMQPLFRHKLVHGDFPAAVFVNFLEMKNPKRFWAVPLDGTKSRLTFSLDGQANDLVPVPLGVPLPDHSGLKVVLKDGIFEVASLELSFLLSYETVPFKRNDGKHHTYRAPDGTAVLHSTFQGEVFGLPARFYHQANPDGSASSIVEFPSGLRLPSQWDGISGRITDVASVDVNFLHMRPITLKGPGEPPHAGFIFTFPEEVLQSSEQLRNLMKTHFFFVNKRDYDRMLAYFADLGKKELHLHEAGFIYQVEKKRVEYIDLFHYEDSDA